MLAVRVRGILFLASAALSEKKLNELEQALHFFLRANADANMARSDVSAITENDFVSSHSGDEIGTGFAKIDENKISGARVGVEAKLVQFLLEPRAQAKNALYIPLHGFAVGNRRL